MDINQFLELLKARKSIRRFKPEAIPEEYIEKMLEAGRWAMSEANAQPWEFIVVRDEETRSRIVDSWFEPHREMFAIEQTRTAEMRLPPLRRFATKTSFAEAPLLIAALADRRVHQAGTLAEHYLNGTLAPDASFMAGIANATQNIHLAAAALGLGSQWVSVTRMWESAIRRILEIPEVLEVHSIAAIGYPDYQPPAAYRRPLSELMHTEKYDRSRYRSTGDILSYLRRLRQATTPAYEPRNQT